MDKQEVRDRVLEIGIVPVVRAPSPGEARIAAAAVCQGGIPIVEITMTVPGALDVIRELAKNSASDVLVGAGTVLNAEAARRCLDAGAQFLVSPGLNLKTVELAVREGKLIIAGGRGADAHGSHYRLGGWRGLRQDFPVWPGRRREVHQGSKGPAPANSACSDRRRQSKHRGRIHRSGRRGAGHRRRIGTGRRSEVKQAGNHS